MSKYANKNTLEYIKALKDANNLEGKSNGCYDNPIYKSFFEVLWENIHSDEDNYKEVYKLIYRYETEKENREGIDLTFLALTGYTLGTLLENAIDTQE